ncbi:MAG: hypothetical protein JWO36_5610 [Myxococcales bacterium]|nr:hypothetical protein [Myxococcales bacterium]
MKTALVLIALSASAGAEPASLTLTHEPPPRHLTMRPRSAAATPEPTPAPRPSPIPTPPDAGPDAGPDAASIRDLHQAVRVRFNLGYDVDGAALTGDPTLGGHQIRSADFNTIRSYGFGEGYLSTHGVGVQSLSSYFAGRFQIVQPRVTTPTDTPPPIATWFDRTGLTTRNAWLEVTDFLSSKTLAPLRIRAGQLYVYGPWVMHMYGAVASWEGKLIRGSVYGGSRVPDYTLSIDQKDRAGIGGSSIKVDLRDLPNPVPLLIGAEVLAFTAAGANKSSQHGQLELDWRPRQDLALIGQARAIDGRLANEHLQFRSRYRQVTNLVFDLTHRHGADWRWDPSVIGSDPSADPLAPKRYLELGPVLPQLLVSVRAGTLIAENIDILARGAVAADLTSATAVKSSFSSSYLELAGALEVRLRRQISIGASALTRQTERHDLIVQQIADTPQPDPLPLSGAIGERGFVELGTTARMSLGARKFSATLEVYGRRTRYARVYCIDTGCGSSVSTGINDTDTRGGGRVQIDAWIGRNVRLFASYDLSSRLALAPEITGYKSLRLMMEGVY